MTSMSLDSIVMNHATLPPRIVLYGDHGIGKTTFGAGAPSPIFLRTEDGLAGIHVPTFPIARTFGDVISALGTLYTTKHPFQTLTIDSLDWLEPLVWAHTAQLENKENIEAFGYGKGYVYADQHWRTFFAGLDALRAQGMTVILLAHSQVVRFNAPDTDPYDRYEIKLHKRAQAIVEEWADVIAFAHYEVHTVDKDAGFNKTTTRAVGVGRRILSVEERPAYNAKNRFNLPADLDFPRVGAFDVFAEACAPAYAAPAPLPFVPPTPDADDDSPPASVDDNATEPVPPIAGGELFSGESEPPPMFAEEIAALAK
jgi:hypothetical protein